MSNKPTAPQPFHKKQKGNKLNFSLVHSLVKKTSYQDGYTKGYRDGYKEGHNINRTQTT